MVSIHAPRVGRDDWLGVKADIDLRFQSTRPVWGATFIGLLARFT